MLTGSLGGGSDDTPLVRVRHSPHPTVYPTDSIERSTNFVESVFQVRVMSALLSLLLLLLLFLQSKTDRNLAYY